ncbi:MAG: hypothetical protein A4E62_00135 [Syntrophorhabdus sp. PtaU1.Bin002]|nr:MAG: hypothetical protein A4E62_00135 [Syntrophorhabdus sp. PtaU1.Bin002]
MNNYLYYILFVFILLTWIISAKYLLPYLHKKGFPAIRKKQKIWLLLIILLILVALAYTYVQTGGTFIWR